MSYRLRVVAIAPLWLTCATGFVLAATGAFVVDRVARWLS